MRTDPEELSRQIIEGNRRAIARAISKIENNDPDTPIILDAVYKHVGSTHRIGITGPPGVGKSTLTSQLITLLRNEGTKIGVIAVDPSSPFTGGAILGDRIRMQNAFTDPDVYIRSMATRGSLGGLARQAGEAADVLAASGKDIIILETVGVGQVELDIMDAADTVIVITVPDMGDVVQGMKAGLMEIGDIFVVNKADLEGAERTRTDLKFVLELKGHRVEWQQKVLLVDARQGKGMDELLSEIRAHRRFLDEKGLFAEKRRKRKIQRVKAIVGEHLDLEFWSVERIEILHSLVDNHSPYEVAEKILK
jgi:LAO/AO transport system kinase